MFENTQIARSERELFLAGPTLYLSLSLQRFIRRAMRFAVEHAHWTPTRGELTAPALIVLIDSELEITGEPDIQRIVGAPEDINEPSHLG